MSLIWFLFILQTLLLSVSAWLENIVSVSILNVDIGSLISSFKACRLHQILNTIFLASIWATQAKRIHNMAYYFKSRRALSSLLLLLTYILLVLLYFEVLPNYYIYRHGLFIIVTAAICFFPYLFPEDTIKNPTDFKEDAYNFALFGKRGQILPVNNPQTGIFIVGAPGCGKTKCVVEPILSQMIYKGYAGILYDYDFSTFTSGKEYSLTHLAYQCINQFKGQKGVRSEFVSINFQDLSKTSRINPIDPTHIEDRKKLSHCIYTLLLNLNPQLAQKDDFWYKNAYSLLKGVIVLLANQYPAYCTLPHAILLGLQPHDSLMAALQMDEEAKLYASPVLDAFKSSPEQFSGVMANFKVLLERLLDKNLFWVLSGNDVPLIVNDPSRPLVFCLGNTPTEKGLISPVLSMIMAVLISNMYGHGRNKSFLMIDELPTLILPNLSEVPATARKYNISTVVALQNIAQLEKAYTSIGAREIQETFSNYFIGRGPFSLSKDLSDMLGKKETEATSTTKSARQVSRTVHQKEEVLITPQDAMTLQTGEFLGKVVHPSGGFFRMQLEPIEAYDKNLGYQYFSALPTINEEIDVVANFTTIQNQVMEIVKEHHNN